MNEMQTLTLNGKKYDSFPDQTAREALEQKQPKGNYLTEHQKLKTINGQSLVGDGNIEVDMEGKVDKTYLVSVFQELKTALEATDIEGAVAVLDEAILDLSALA